MTKFIFDLDGTITKQETLPLISSYFNVQEEIDKLIDVLNNPNIKAEII